MPNLYRSLFPAALFVALCSPFATAQVEPGSLDDLLGAEFAPLRSTEQLPELSAPLLMPPPPIQLEPDPQVGPVQSVLEIPRVTPEEPAPGALILPELTMPTPENTRADFTEDRRVLRPQIDVRPENEIQLLPFDNRDSVQTRKPQMQTPQALPYGSAASPRSRLLSVPVQVEFFTVTRRYVPYGGYGSYGYNNRPYGSYRPSPPRGYRPVGGYGYRPGGYGYGGRDCPSRR